MNLRIKTHSTPGDVNKRQKEALLEGRVRDFPRYTTRKGAKTYKKVVRMKERAVLKIRTKAMVWD